MVAFYSNSVIYLLTFFVRVLGVMKIDDMKWLFKGVRNQLEDVRSYIVSLLQKFEVALLWDHDNLIIPSLLPTEADLNSPKTDSAVVLVSCNLQFAELLIIM